MTRAVPSSGPPPGVVVGIGGGGLETYRSAVRLGAEEAALRQVPLRLVHGSRPTGQGGFAELSSMTSRQQRGRRLVDGAARDLAGTALGRTVRIWTESSPRTGTDLLLTHARTAVMVVLQRGNRWHRSPGPTMRAVTAAAECPTLVTRSGEPSSDPVGVLVLLDLRHDPAPAIVLAFAEASMRRIAVLVLEGRGGVGAARVAIRRAGIENPTVRIRYEEVAPAHAPGRVRQVSGHAALMVVVRPATGEESGLVAGAVSEATCPVLMVAALDAGR